MRNIDLPLLFTVCLTVFFGVLMVYDASSVTAFHDFGDKYHFLKEQALWATVGLTILLISSFIDYHFWYKMAVPMLVITIILLASVFIPGVGVSFLGAKRWIDVGITTFQPAELAKLSFIMYLAAWFSRPEKGRVWAFLLLFITLVGLVILEPDMGTAIILGAISLILYFLSEAPVIQFITLLPVITLVSAFFVIREPYRLARVLTFLNIDKDPLGSSYHIRQALIALGTGGLTGAGLGQSLQKYSYLPESTTDSIFAIIAEELGFIGAAIIILLLVFIILRGIKIALLAKDQFGKLLALAIATLLAVEIITNLSALVALIPLTGVPLPFVSYGGSSLIVSLTSVGILLNISKKT